MQDLALYWTRRDIHSACQISGDLQPEYEEVSVPEPWERECCRTIALRPLKRSWKWGRERRYLHLRSAPVPDDLDISGEATALNIRLRSLELAAEPRLSIQRNQRGGLGGLPVPWPVRH